MPNSPRHIPSYRHYKPKDLAVVRIDRHDRYLGKYNSPESREKYDRLIAEWLADGRQSLPHFAPDNGAACTSVNELILPYWRFAKCHYVKNGKSTGALPGLRVALRLLRQLYGRTPASEFGPKKLKAVRQQMIETGLSRGVINARVGQIKRLFKWAVAEELVPPSVYHGLQAVAGLGFGRTSARETEPVRPVPDLYVAAVLPFVTPHVAAMIKLQRLTGMRPKVNWKLYNRKARALLGEQKNKPRAGRDCRTKSELCEAPHEGEEQDRGRRRTREELSGIRRSEQVSKVRDLLADTLALTGAAANDTWTKIAKILERRGIMDREVQGMCEHHESAKLSQLLEERFPPVR